MSLIPAPRASPTRRFPSSWPPLEDQRFSLDSYARATTMVDTVGWGQGTGSIYTPQNIPAHVSKALVSQFQTYGMNVSYDPSIRCHVKGTSDHPRIELSGRNSHLGEVLCGVILDYQFELDHPRLMIGPQFSILDYGAGALLSAQASIRLYLVSGRNGRILWSGTGTSGQQKSQIHPPHLKEQAVEFLDGTLSQVLAKSAAALSKAEPE